MSNHKDSLVKVLEYLVNEDREKASDLLHDVFVEKAKNHWASLSESDESVEDDIQDEDLDETYEVEEGINNYDAEEDFLSDIETAEDEIEAEEVYGEDDHEGEEEMDMDGEEPEMDMDMDMDSGEEDAAEPEEALANVEDAIAELRAAFADMMDDEPAMEESITEAHETLDHLYKLRISLEDAVKNGGYYVDISNGVIQVDSDTAKQFKYSQSTGEDELPIFRDEATAEVVLSLLSQDDDMDEAVEAVEEGATMSAVSVTHTAGDDGAKSPVGPGDASMSPAKPVNISGGATEAGGKAPAAKDMGVTGPQEAGSPSAAPAPKRETTSSTGPVRGMK